MSYRAFRRLLGETDPERKFRFLFAAFILLVISCAFWFYGTQAERLADDQLTTACRLLVSQIVERQVTTGCGPPDQPRTDEQKRLAKAAEEFQDDWEKNWPNALKRYQFTILKPAGQAGAGPAQLKEFLADPTKQEESERLPHAGVYYGAVRAGSSCLGCHRQMDPELRQGDLLALVKIQVPVQAAREDRHVNRALLLSTALVTAMLLVGGSFVLVRHCLSCPRPPAGAAGATSPGRG